MERVGLFSEPGYVTINDTYKGSRASKFPCNKLFERGNGKIPVLELRKCISSDQWGTKNEH